MPMPHSLDFNTAVECSDTVACGRYNRKVENFLRASRARIAYKGNFRCPIRLPNGSVTFPKKNGSAIPPPAVQAIWEKLELKAGVRVFECPCGKADLSFPLARLGANVSGIDFNSHFVSAAKNKFSRAGLAGEFKTDDMRTAQFPEQMDLIINWARSFGYFSDKDNADLLARFAKSLVEGGRLLIEVANPSRVLAGEATRIIASGEQVCETWDAESKRATVIFPATQFRGPVSASVRVYSCDEYRSMLAAAGLKLVDFYGQGFTEFTSESTRLIVLAQR